MIGRKRGRKSLASNVTGTGRKRGREGEGRVGGGRKSGWRKAISVKVSLSTQQILGISRVNDCELIAHVEQLKVHELGGFF